MMRLIWTTAAAVTVTMMPAAFPTTTTATEAEVSAETSLDEAASVGSVNGEPILPEDIERLLGGMHGSVEEGSRAEWDAERLMFRVVNDILLAQEARALGMDEDERIQNELRSYREQLMKSVLEFEFVGERARPTEDEVRQLFQRQYRRVSLRVLTTYERDEAVAALEEVREGADLETLIGERSKDMFRLRGGIVEDAARIDLIRGISEVVFDLEPGSMGGPVSTELGWSIFRVESFTEADPELFDAMEPTVRALVRQKKTQALKEALAAEAREHHAVSIDAAVVTGIVPERIPDGRLMPKVDDPEAVVAHIGEARTLTAKQYGKALLQRWSGVRNSEAAVAAAPMILDRLIDDEVLLAEAARRGYGDRPEIRNRVRAFERQLLVPRYLEEILAAGIEVSQEETKGYYEENTNRFRRPPRIRLGQITVGTEEEARKIADLLRSGADLGWLAREHSSDRFAESGGDRGWYSPQATGDLLSENILAAEPGAVLDPFGVRGNWIVIKVLVREEQGIYEFDEVSGNVRNAVFAKKFRETVDAVVQKLRERSTIEIDEARVASLTMSGSFDENAKRDTHGHGQ